MIKKCLHVPQKKAGSVRKSSIHTMKNRLTVFSIPLLWIHIQWDIQGTHIQICRSITKSFSLSLTRSKKLPMKVPVFWLDAALIMHWNLIRMLSVFSYMRICSLASEGSQGYMILLMQRQRT